MDIVILGLAITSSWGNGHATTYRSLVRGLAQRGHKVTFLERDAEWYSSNRDLPRPPGATTQIYSSVQELQERSETLVRNADAVIVGSYVPSGIAIGGWVQQTARGVTAFYDIDTPVTVANLRRGEEKYISRRLIPGYDLYLSFTGGPLLREIEREFGARMARPLYCSVDADRYRPIETAVRWNLGYLGTYSDDRQLALERLLVQPARAWRQGKFVVAGPQYPKKLRWPRNVERITHLSPDRHQQFYCSQRFTLNITRAEMIKAGYSPSVRLFEASACGTPIISDYWQGLEEIFAIGHEIFVADTGEEMLKFLRDMSDGQRTRAAAAARKRILQSHTSERRAGELESYLLALRKDRTMAAASTVPM